MKYRSRSNTRGHRKRSILKPRKKEKLQTSLELRSRVVDSSNDNLYNDTSISSTYAWTRISPIASDNVKRKRTRLESLRDLCAMELAKNVDELDESYLNHASWSCWKIVWDNVLKLNLDNLHAFSMFASKFWNQKDFKVHKGDIETKFNETIPRLRALSINSVIIPNSTRHRIENLFSNVSLSGIAKYIHSLSFHPYVILDLSRRRISKKDELYMIFNIRNLIALNISNSEVIDDQYLHHLFLSIAKDDKLKNLTILQVYNCPRVTKNGFRNILALSKTIGIESSLAYIETDQYLDREDFTKGFRSDKSEFRYVAGTNWAAMDKNTLDSKVLINAPLGFKLHVLYRHFSKMIIKENETSLGITTNSLNYLHRNHRKPILDVMIHPGVMVKNIEEDYASEIEDVWKRRMSRSSIQENRYSYIVDHRKSLNGNITKSTHKTMTKLNSLEERSTKRKKPRLINKNAEKFFEL